MNCNAVKNILLILIYSLLIIGCKKPIKNVTKDFTISNFQKEDSLVAFYEQVIINHYNEANANDFKIELEVSGKRAYEDGSILILTFNEILKFGSWHYTNSSLLFIKDGDMLIPVTPNTSDINLLNDDFYERDIKYLNRIQGEFKELIDLTGDGKPECVFHTSGSIRTTLEEQYNIYRLNMNDKSIELSNLHISSDKVQGECNTVFGTSREYEIIEKESVLPIIAVNEIQSVCNDISFKVEELSSKLSYYRWNNQEEKFEEILYEDDDTNTTVFSISEYLDLEIISEDFYGPLTMTKIDKDTIQIISENRFSISSSPFKLINTQLDSIEVEQSRLEFVSISMPPSDGFDSAILDELVLQSDWIPYKMKNKTCIPFSAEDYRFDIKNKPNLSESFITNILSKSTSDIAPELLSGFLQTDKSASWVNCIIIIRIKGIDDNGKTKIIYITGDDLCFQD